MKTENNLIRKVPLNNIIFIEYFERNCLIHCIEENILIRNTSLKNLLTKLSSPNLVYTNKSNIANIKNIKSIKKLSSTIWSINFFHTKLSVPLSLKYKKELFKLINIK